MKAILIVLLLGISAICSGTQDKEDPSQKLKIMLTGVSRDETMFKGGISSSKWTGKGTLATEVIAWITPDGVWSKLPCDNEHWGSCRRFAQDYLAQRHTNKVISSDGYGATVVSAPVSLSECYGYDGTGTYSGASISGSAVAVSSEEYFARSVAPKPLDKDAASLVGRKLAALIPQKIDSLKNLRLFSLELEGQNMIVLQRAFADYSDDPESLGMKLIFAIGQVDDNRFNLVHWKSNTEDEEERILGTFRLKNGREFLLTVVSEPESQFFRAYGIKAGKLQLVFSGGGASC
jgi:hypothetical protein